MDRLSLHAEERTILGKKVKNLRKDGKLPGHVFGKGLEGENVLVSAADFLKTFQSAGETGLIDLKIGTEKVRPVLIREVQYNPVDGKLIHIDFYQVNLSEKVKVPVPIELIGQQPEKVHLGEAIVLQTLNEVEVEALPTDLIEKLEVDVAGLKEIDDAITVAELIYDREKITVHAEPEEIVVKLAPAVTAEMEKLLEEEKLQVEAAAAKVAEEGVTPAEGEAKQAAEGEAPTEGETPVQAEEPFDSAQGKPPEEPKKE